MSAMSELHAKAKYTPEQLTARDWRLLSALLGVTTPEADGPDVEAAELAELRSHAGKWDGYEPPSMSGCPCQVCEATREAIRLHWRTSGQSRRIDVPEVSDEAFARFFTA